jgi:electron transport complex protein RnfB
MAAVDDAPRAPDVPAPPRARARGAAGVPQVAFVDATRCIGCTLCIAACPVDAIIGAPKRLHGVLAEFCSGCELCVPPCPVDCIVMRPAARDWSADDVTAARARYDARLLRRARPAPRTKAIGEPAQRRAQAIAAALDRARARRAAIR